MSADHCSLPMWRGGGARADSAMIAPEGPARLGMAAANGGVQAVRLGGFRDRLAISFSRSDEHVACEQRATEPLEIVVSSQPNDRPTTRPPRGVGRGQESRDRGGSLCLWRTSVCLTSSFPNRHCDARSVLAPRAGSDVSGFHAVEVLWGCRSFPTPERSILDGSGELASDQCDHSKRSASPFSCAGSCNVQT